MAHWQERFQIDTALREMYNPASDVSVHHFRYFKKNIERFCHQCRVDGTWLCYRYSCSVVQQIEKSSNQHEILGFCYRLYVLQSLLLIRPSTNESNDQLESDSLIQRDDHFIHFLKTYHSIRTFDFKHNISVFPCSFSLQIDGQMALPGGYLALPLSFRSTKGLFQSGWDGADRFCEAWANGRSPK